MKTAVKMEGVIFAKILITYVDVHHVELVEFLGQFNYIETPNEQRDLFASFTDLVHELRELGIGFQTLLPYEYPTNPDLVITLKINGDIDFRKYNN